MSLFLVVEGPDGVGKGEQIRRLLARLETEGRRVWSTLEPTDGEVGKRIRRILNKQEEKPDPDTFQLLYVQDRAEHVREIKRRLDAGECVLSDRYYYSTLAYGAVAGANVDMLRRANSKFPTPDVAIWLNLDSEQARQRMQQRGELDDHDANLDFQQRLQGAYRSLLAERPEMVEVDASGTPEEVHERVWRAVSAKLEQAPMGV